MLASSLDEDDGEEVFPMDMSAISKGCFHWVPTEFSNIALSRHFGQAGILHLPSSTLVISSGSTVAVLISGRCMQNING